MTIATQGLQGLVGSLSVCDLGPQGLTTALYEFWFKGLG